MVPSIFAVVTADKRAASAKQSRQRRIAKRKDALIGGQGVPAEARSGMTAWCRRTVRLRHALREEQRALDQEWRAVPKE